MKIFFEGNGPIVSDPLNRDIVYARLNDVYSDFIVKSYNLVEETFVCASGGSLQIDSDIGPKKKELCCTVAFQVANEHEARGHLSWNPPSNSGAGRAQGEAMATRVPDRPRDGSRISLSSPHFLVIKLSPIHLNHLLHASCSVRTRSKTVAEKSRVNTIQVNSRCCNWEQTGPPLNGKQKISR